MPNPWLEHVKKERAKAKNKGKSYKEILVLAKGTYKGKAATKSKKRCVSKAVKECESRPSKKKKT